MLKLWCIELFWLALALPGFAVLRRWDRESLRHGFLFGLGRSYLASLVLLTPFSVLGYWQHWPLWALSAAYLASLLLGGAALVRSYLVERRAPAATATPRVVRTATPTLLAAVGCIALALDGWLGLRAGAHVQGDAGYHIARVRMLISEGLSNWDPIVAEPRIDIIYFANIYHALIGVSGQLTGSDAALAWLGTWPFVKLLAATGAFQLGCSAFGSLSYGWLATLALVASQCAYSALPLPNSLAPLALLPMGLCAGMQLFAARPPPLTAAWLAASALVLAQVHALNAVFLALVVAPVLLLVLLLRAAFRRGDKRMLLLGTLACLASLPWILSAGGPRIQLMLRDAFPALRPAAPASGPTPARSAAPENATENAASPEPEASPEITASAPRKPQYKSDRFRKLPNGLSVYEPGQLRGAGNANLIALALALVALALVRRPELWALAGFVASTCAWLLVPILCTTLLRLTGAPWAALRINQVLPLAFFSFASGGPLACVMWLARRRGMAWQHASRWSWLLQLAAAGLALFAGQTQSSHGEPWTLERLWQHAQQHEARQQWQSIASRQQLWCQHIPAHETVMTHPRWDYALPMHCRLFAVVLAPERGWHGLPFMDERRADVDEFFRDGTSGSRRMELMRKYALHYVYTNQRFARRISASLPSQSHVLASAREGAVVRIDY